MIKEGDFWDEKSETMTREEIEAHQLKELQKTVELASKTPFYKRIFSEIRLEPGDIKKLEDLNKLPFTTKDDLRAEYPLGMLAVPRDELIRLHVSSGTTGQATAVFFTKADLDRWAELVARCMYMTGCRRYDVFQNMMGYGLFTGGLGFHYGAEKIGMLVIPAGSGNSRKQIQLMKDFGTTVIHIIPSYALYLINIFEDEGIDLKRDLDLRIAYLGAEPHSEITRQKIEEAYGVDAYNSYGLSELNGPGVAFECKFKTGMHIWEDAYIPEIIDPATMLPVEDGEEGELVLTSLGRKAMPLLRYRTKDITAFLKEEECPCGRRHRRIHRIKGRTDDMIIFKGVNIFPVQVEKTLMKVEGVGTQFQILLDRKGFSDEMTVTVELTREAFASGEETLEDLRKEIRNRLKNEILISPKVEFAKPGTFESTGGKAVRVIDKRKL